MKAVNRGGLFTVNDTTFNLFKLIESKTRTLLPQHLQQAGTTCFNKEELVKSIGEDEMVQVHWRRVAVDIIDEEDSNYLLYRIVEMWMNMRGFALTSKWMEDYKQAKDKIVKRTMSLRKELKTVEPEV